MKKVKESIHTIRWALQTAMAINAKILLLWGSVSLIVSILPAIALYFNRQSVSILSEYIHTREGSFRDVVPSIVALGITLAAVGLSRRINGNFLYFVMYDAYYFGLEEYVMDAVQRVEIKDLLDKKYRDDHWTVLSRCGALTDFMSSGCLFLSKVIGTVSLLLVAAQTSWVIFVIATAYIFFVLCLNVFSADKLRWDARKYNEASRLSNYYQASSMSPGVAKEMRVYHLQEETIKKWQSAYLRVEDIDRGYVRTKQTAAALSSGGFYIFLSAMMVHCIYRVASGSIQIDAFLTLYALGQSISELSGVLSSSFQEMDRGLFFLNIIRRFLQTVPQNKDNHLQEVVKANPEIVFQADDICFSYDDEHEVLRNISFSIKKGETIALLGANGSGKTTLVKILIGLFTPTKGNLYFYGRKYDDTTRNSIIRNVGMFFQNFYIFHSSLRDNVGYGDIEKINDSDRILKAITKGGAAKLLSQLPLGLDQWLLRNVKKNGALLSGGEQQRVAASRAYMSDKEILIFDEPAAALDPIAEMRQFEAIREKIDGRTAVLISHRVGFARLADKIFVLSEGQLCEQGAHDELMEMDGVYAEFFREQAKWYTTEEEYDEN